jgi:hypothetical protein
MTIADPHAVLAELVLEDEPESGAKRARVGWLARSIAQAIDEWLQDNPTLDEDPDR